MRTGIRDRQAIRIETISIIHLRFPGTSTKRVIHDLLRSRVYVKIKRSNTLAGHENMDDRGFGQAVHDNNEEYRLDHGPDRVFPRRHM